ncbi:mercury resistance system periplasmic binding protein MerP [Ramlibacter sp.]|uniref:mercury resistance system periplasmic binding protein MerP n=1 Tax=Ramlibacter sp. TaxID=1917967 RepID=UPI003D0A9F55
MKTAFLILALLAGQALAAPQTATLSVPTMSCASCPVTIKAALSKVPGVATVKSDFAKRQTTVVFDDAKTSLAALSKATADAGFPSTPVGAAK